MNVRHTLTCKLVPAKLTIKEFLKQWVTCFVNSVKGVPWNSRTLESGHRPRIQHKCIAVTDYVVYGYLLRIHSTRLDALCKVINGSDPLSGDLEQFRLATFAESLPKRLLRKV